MNESVDEKENNISKLTQDTGVTSETEPVVNLKKIDLNTEILKETMNESVDEKENNISKLTQDTGVTSETEPVVNLKKIDLNTEILKETMNESVDEKENNISKLTQDTGVTSETEPVVNLKKIGLNTEILKETMNESVDEKENNISKLTQDTGVTSETEPVVNLKQIDLNTEILKETMNESVDEKGNNISKLTQDTGVTSETEPVVNLKKIDLNTEILKETMNESVDEKENNISKPTQDTDVISENEPVVNLDEFDNILNEMCVCNPKIENKKSTLSDTQTQKRENVSLHDVIDLIEIEDTVDDHKIQNDKKKPVTLNLYPNDAECELTVSVDYKATETLKLKQTDIIDLDATESDTDPDNLKKDEIKDNLKAVVSKETDIISLSSDSEDDGYNSSDFEIISESEAKTNCLTKTNYYNADYMKYHKSRYLPCKISSSKAKRESHVIPQGESYLNLFRGMYAPAVINNLYYASKKRVLPVTHMTLQDGNGFDVYDNKCEKNEEYKYEANESLEQIRFLYPDENRKRRRRF